ncbi:MAG: DNA polymerase III subunit gamma/tau [Oscillospiraceae bacterium]|nr:DNA polymerase III subunit gamma/tau [Oscillospiraceae bacterium]
MYQALYRKWRPRTFDEVSGQQHITKILRMQCREDRVAHAYLFCGTRGTGKTSIAKILAKAVNCEHPVDGNPCNQCPACKEIDAGISTDVQEIDAASHTGVDDVRSLTDEVVYPPSVLKKRVYIIDEVHMLSIAAFNALLKTLEEPPPYVVFVLATTELSKLPATIVSRCIRFDFNRLAEEIIADRLRYVAKEEHILLGEGAPELLARLADGAMRDGLSILEACTSGVGSENEITAEAIRERLGIANGEKLTAFYRAVAQQQIPDALATLDDVYRSSKDIGVFLEDLAVLARDMLVLRQLSGNDRPGGKDRPCGTFRFREEASSLLEEFPSHFTSETLFYICSVLDDAQSRMTRFSTDKKILMEFAAIRLCDLSLSDSPQALAARVARLEKGALQAPEIRQTPAESVPAPTAKAAPKDPPKEAPQAPPQETGVPFEQYAELAEELAGHPDLLPYLTKLQAFIENDRFVIVADAFTNRMLQRGTNAATLAEAVRAVTGRSYTPVFRDRVPKSNENAPINEL